MPTRAFVDANVFKFAATALTRLEARDEVLEINGNRCSLRLHKFVVVNPNDGIKDPELLKEVELLPEIAEAAKLGDIELVTHQETIWESLGLPNMDSATGRFYNAPMATMPHEPAHYRVLGGGNLTAKQWKQLFVGGIRDRRFEELKVVTGANQAKTTKGINQAIDAFHLWQAELSDADVFLSLDFKLARLVERARCRQPVRVVRPSELLAVARGEAS